MQKCNWKETEHIFLVKCIKLSLGEKKSKLSMTRFRYERQIVEYVKYVYVMSCFFLISFHHLAFIILRSSIQNTNYVLWFTLQEDMIDDATTFVSAAEVLKERGACKIYVMATHGLLSSDAPKLLDASPIDEVYFNLIKINLFPEFIFLKVYIFLIKC